MPFNPNEGLAGIVYFIVGLFNSIVPVLVAAATVLFMIGVVKYIHSEGEKEKGGIILWSLVALFVMLSMWGILRLLCGTFTSSATCSSATNYNAGTGVYKESGPPSGGGLYPI